MTDVEKRETNRIKWGLKRIFTSIILGAMAIAWLVSAIMTVLPDSTASKTCYLGYRAHCSFTPFGTLILIIGLIATCVVIWKVNCLGYTSFRSRRAED